MTTEDNEKMLKTDTGRIDAHFYRFIKLRFVKLFWTDWLQYAE